jgi:uncharacterized membrane protein YtjA (UPF0391 family)
VGTGIGPGGNPCAGARVAIPAAATAIPSHVQIFFILILLALYSTPATSDESRSSIKRARKKSFSDSWMFSWLGAGRCDQEFVLELNGECKRRPANDPAHSRRAWLNFCDRATAWTIWQLIGCTGKIPARLQLSTYGSIRGSRLVSTCAFNFRILVNVEGVCASASVQGREEGTMLYYALIFLVVALVAGFLGFGGIAFAAAGIAKIFFFIFLVVFLVTLLMHLLRGNTAGN